MALGLCMHEGGATRVLVVFMPPPGVMEDVYCYPCRQIIFTFGSVSYIIMPSPSVMEEVPILFSSLPADFQF